MSNRLPFIENDLKQAHSACVSHLSQAAESALLAGQLLLEAKDQHLHGEWLGWLHSLDIPERSAQRYMKLAKAGLKSDTVADLGLVEAERFASNLLKFWPEPEQATISVGTKDGRGFHLFVVRPSSEEFAYYVELLHSDSVPFVEDKTAEVVSMPRALPADFIGDMHDRLTSCARIQRTQHVPSHEALSYLASSVCIELVQHQWGMRLEDRGRAA